jgi:hypothetical protein
MMTLAAKRQEQGRDTMNAIDPSWKRNGWMPAGALARVRRSGLAVASLAAMSLLLSGCIFNSPLDRELTSATTLEPSPLDGYQYELAREMPVSRAFVELPMMTGPIIAVREKRYANGVEQIVVLESEAAADGENRVEIRVVQDSRADSRIKNEYLQVRTTRQEQIRSDFREFVWGVPMQIVSAVEANAYGTYGYALGRSKQGYNCLLGWQNVKGVMRQKRLLGFISTATTQMSVRLRICRTDLTEDQLVSIIRGMRITVDPSALMEEPRMIWSNEGHNIAGSIAGNGTAPGYVTEGVAMPDGGTLPLPDVEPVAEQPAVTSAPAAPQRSTRPRTETAPANPPARQTPPRRSAPRTTDEVAAVSDPRELDGLDPLRNKTTIFVDPRDYATVPAPGAGAIAPQRPVQGATGQSRLVPPSSSVLAPAGSGGLQSQDAREQRKEMVRQIPLSGEGTLTNSKLNRNGARPSAASGGSDGRDLFLAPEREGYRGLNLEDLQRQSRVEGDNAKHNLWLNDLARDDRTGLPLGRPCELLKSGRCEDAPSPQSGNY